MAISPSRIRPLLLLSSYFPVNPPPLIRAAQDICESEGLLESQGKEVGSWAVVSVMG
jgi:hypothetical protein